MLDWLASVWLKLFPRDRTVEAVDGYQKLTGSMREWQEHVEERLEKSEARSEKCEQERDEQRKKIVALEGELHQLKRHVNDCDEERGELRGRVETLETKVN